MDTRNGVPARVLHNRDFRFFFVAQTISVIGTWMQVTALGWLVYRLSGSAYLVATLVFLNQIPVLFLSVWAGILADRFDRRRLLIFTQSFSGVVTLLLAVLVFARESNLAVLFGLVAAGGMVYALDLPARQSFLCDLVGKAQLRHAIVLNSLSFHFARMLGPVIAGILIATTGEGLCVLLNGLSFLAVATTLVFIRNTGRRQSEQTESRRVLEGFLYVRQHRDLARALLLLAVASLLGAQHSTFIPVLTRENLHAGAQVLGTLMSAPGLGALAAALLLLFRASNDRLSSLLPFTTIGSGVALVLLAWSGHIWLAEGLLIFLGFCVTLQNASSNILLQASAPEWIRGQIMALSSVAFMGLMPLGALILGAATRHASVSIVLSIAGMLCVILAVSIVFGFRATAKADHGVAETRRAGGPTKTLTAD